MTPVEWWWEFDCRRTDKEPGPNMSEDQMADLYELIK
jgi:hypothetical protein